MRGEPVAAEAGMTLQQPEARRAFSGISLFIFILDDLSIGESGVLKSPTLIVLLSLSSFMDVSICLIY